MESKFFYRVLTFDIESTMQGLAYEVCLRYTGFYKNSGRWARRLVWSKNYIIMETIGAQHVPTHKFKYYVQKKDEYQFVSFSQFLDDLESTLDSLPEGNYIWFGYRFDNDFRFLRETDQYIASQFGVKSDNRVLVRDPSRTFTIRFPRHVQVIYLDGYSMGRDIPEKRLNDAVKAGWIEQYRETNKQYAGYNLTMELVYRVWFSDPSYVQTHIAVQDCIDLESVLFEYLRTYNRLPETPIFGKTPRQLLTERIDRAIVAATPEPQFIKTEE